MDPAPEQTSGWGRRGWQIAIWLCLISAFSPVLLELFGHIVDNAWARTILIFPWLVWVVSRRQAESPSSTSRPVSHRIVWAWLLAGIAIELVSIGGGALRFGRVGLLVAAIGLCHSLHGMRFEVSVLWIWALPMSRTLIELASPEMQTLWGHVGAAMIPGLTLEVLGPLPILTTADAELRLLATDSGVAMAYGLAGLGWYRMISVGRTVGEAVIGALRWAAFAIPVQISFIIFSGVLLKLTNESEWPRFLLTESNWLFVLGMGLALCFRNASSKEQSQSIGVTP